MPPEIHKATSMIHDVVEETHRSISPIRRTIFRRFPMLFTLLVTFGVAATFFALERIFAVTPIFNNHPWFTLSCGLFVLLVTGKLYAKLG
jgi:hypothetical protein